MTKYTIWSKRVWAVLLAAVMLLTVTPLAAFADESLDILFADDFSTDSGNWTTSGGAWTVADGVYKQTNGGNVGAMSFAGDTSWSDYEVETTISDFDANYYIMLCARVQDTKNRYIASYTGSKLLIDRRVNGVSAELTSKSYKLSADTPVTMKFRCVGSKLSVYVNGTLELETTDSTHATGKIGLATYKTKANFDNVVVRSITETLNVISMTNNLSDYQVVQRDVSTQSAIIPVAGRVDADVASVEAAVLAYSSDTSVVDWTIILVNDGAYAGSLTVPQGGWYRLAVRAKDASGEILKTMIGENRWGVGINILCIGQSNMVGQGAAPYTEAHDLVSNFRNGSWSHLADPYDGAGASLVPSMANQLVEELGLPIGIIPAADSGSGLHAKNPAMPSHGSNWYWMYYNTSNPADTSTLYGRALFRAKAAGGVELTVWNQGETDGYIQVPKDTYKADMALLLNRFRTDLGNTALPMFLCQIGPHVVKDGFDDAAYTAIRSAQNELDDGENFFMTATELDLPQNSDGIHYATAGLDVIGQRVANGILYYYGKSEYYRGPYIASAAFADETKSVVDVKIVHRGGNDIIPADGITGFTVLNDDCDVTVMTTQRMNNDTVRLTLDSGVAGTGKVRYLYGLVPDNANVIKDNTALALPLEATTEDIVIGGSSDDDDKPVVDTISFISGDSTVYPVEKLVQADRYSVSSDSVTVSNNKTAYATMPDNQTTSAYYAFSTKTVGSYIEFTLPVAKTGVYTLSVEAYSHSNRGTYQTYWAGETLGATFSQKTTGLDNSDTAARVLIQTPGMVTVDKVGEITVRFRTTVAGTLAFCNILLTPVTVQPDADGSYVYAMGELPVKTSANVTITNVDLGNNSEKFYHYATPAGGTVTVTLPISNLPAGVYTLSGKTLGHTSRGAYSVTMGNNAVSANVQAFIDSQTFTQYSSSGGSAADRVLSHIYCDLLIHDGQRTLTLTLTAKTTAIGFFSFRLTPVESGVYPVQVLNGTTQGASGSAPAYEYYDTTIASRVPRIYDVVRAMAAGDYVEYTVPDVQSGVYTISAETFTHDKSRGKYRLYLPESGEYLGDTYSQLASPTAAAERVKTDTYGQIKVEKAGDLKLRFVVAGANNNSFTLSFCRIMVKPVKVSVRFVGKYQEVIASKTVTSAEELATALANTTAPSLGGYRFTGWSENVDDSQLTFDTACQRDDHLIIAVAVYEKSPSAKEYQLTMSTAMTAVDGFSNTVDASTQLSFDQRIIATAQPTADEKVAYWLLDDAKVGFGQSSYVFYVSGNNTIQPVFEDEATSDLLPEVVIQQVVGSTGSDNHTLTVIAQTSIPNGYTLQSCGMIYTGSTDALRAIKAGTASEDQYVQVVSGKTTNQQYMTHLLNVQSGRTRYAMAYAVVTGADGQTITIWSSTVVQFKTTADGVSIVKGSIA